jgi:hypothetical protein
VESGRRRRHPPGDEYRAPEEGCGVRRAGDPTSAQKLETQLLHFDGRHWHGYSYAWNAAGTDADLVPTEGKSLVLEITDPQAPGGTREQTWRFLARSECQRCHNEWAGTTLAFNVEQLNRDVPGPDPGTTMNQLRDFRSRELLADVVVEPDPEVDPFATVRRPGPEADLPRLTDPHDRTAPLDARARAYLHVNCAGCRRSIVSGPSSTGGRFWRACSNPRGRSLPNTAPGSRSRRTAGA